MFYKVKTDYGSPKQSLITLSSLATIALKNKVKHIVITDNTLYAVPKAQELFADNLHLIIGLQLYLCEDPEDPNRMPLEFSLYAKNYDGYLTLCKIQTESQKHVITRDGNRTYPTVTIQLIKEMLGSPLGKGNVFMSTGGNDGIILGVIDKDAIKNDIDNEKKANLGKIYEKIQNLRDLKHEHSELEAEKEISAALAKRKFDSEKQKYALMENPPVSDVEDMLRRIEETEIAKETLKTVVSKINSLHSKIKGEEISIARMCGFDTFQDKLVDQYLKDSVQNLFGEEVENINEWFKGNAASGIENIDTLNVSKIRNELNKFKTIAEDDLLVDIESHSTDTEMIYMPIICRISEELGIRIIASHECCPYVNTFEPPQKARIYGIFRHSAFTPRQNT